MGDPIVSFPNQFIVVNLSLKGNVRVINKSDQLILPSNQTFGIQVNRKCVFCVCACTFQEKKTSNCIFFKALALSSSIIIQGLVNQGNFLVKDHICEMIYADATISIAISI